MDDGFARREHVIDRRARERRDLFHRQGSEDVYAGEPFDKATTVRLRAVRFAGSLYVERARRESEVQSGALEGVPDALAYERVRVVILGIILEPVFDLIVHAVVAQVLDADDGRDLLRH